MASSASATTTGCWACVKGVDGIKTGYTRASGFNLVSSVQRDGRSIVAVVLGGKQRRLAQQADVRADREVPAQGVARRGFR